MATLTADEFTTAADHLIKYCCGYNDLAREPIELQLIPAYKSYMSTAKTYLQLNNTFDIVYCPIYQVPVLYSRQSAHASLNRLQKDIVSFTEHPITGISCVFFHPCMTATIMKELLLEEIELNSLQYLITWLGVHNRLADLCIPLEFFANKDLIIHH